MRVTLYMYGAGQTFGLVNETHTDKVELYSNKRTRPSVKIAQDETLLNIIDYLGENGFADNEQDGSAPGGGAFTLCFEVETAAGTSHWGTNPRTNTNEERLAMNRCVAYFVNKNYNQIESLQAVQNDEGASLFDDRPMFGKDSFGGNGR